MTEDTTDVSAPWARLVAQVIIIASHMIGGLQSCLRATVMTCT